MATKITLPTQTEPMWHESDEFKTNFKVNLWLGSIIKKYFTDELKDVDWAHISPELQTAINKITYSLRDASVLSDKECERTQRK